MKLLKNKLSRFIRHYTIANKCKIPNLGYRAHISASTKITQPQNLEVGEYSYIGGGCFLSTEGGIKIGKATSIAFSTVILSSNHNWDSEEMIPYDQYSIKKKVIIGDYCWVGCHCKISPGVTINEGAIVAMGSVVTKDIPKGAIVGGNPAEIIKYRDMELFDKLKKDGKIYHQIKNNDPNFRNIFINEDEI